MALVARSRLLCWTCLAVGAALTLAGCGTQPLSRELPEAPDAIALRAPDFQAGSRLPDENTCRGASKSPALRWSGVPRGTVELALVVVDEDARPRPMLQWLVFAIDPRRTGLEAGETTPESRQAKTSFGPAEYRAPCPPRGRSHRIVIAIYALSGVLEEPDSADAGAVLAGIDRLATARGLLGGVATR